MKVIPAIDIIGGKTVRLKQGDFAVVTEYIENPSELAKKYAEAGFRYLHLVDLDGAKAGSLINQEILISITSETPLLVDWGGGIVGEEDIQLLLKIGAERVTIGSAAVKFQDMFKQWLKRFGGEKIILAADVRDGKVAVNGWKDTSEVKLDELIKLYLPHGLKYLLCTDINRDGMMAGPAVDLYKRLHQDYPELNIIASGGVAFTGDIRALAETGIWGVVVGKALLEGKINPQEITDFM